MRKLRWAAFKGKSLISKAIRFYTRSTDYSHIAVVNSPLDTTQLLDVVTLNKKHQFLIEAWNHSGNPFKQWIDFSGFDAHSTRTEYEIWELEVNDEIYTACMRAWREMAKEKVKYDWASIIGFVLKTKKDVNSGKMMCSEMSITPIAYWKNWLKIRPHKVHPDYFICLIQAAGGQMVKVGVT